MANLTLQFPDSTEATVYVNNVPAWASWDLVFLASDGDVARENLNKLVEALKKKLNDYKCQIATTAPVSLTDQERKRLILLVGDGNEFDFSSIQFNAATDTVLPMFKKKTTGLKLQDPYINFNAYFWTRDISEAVVAIFAKVGVVDDEMKIFISYKRSDTEDLAVQLFDKLNHEGFEVFLDRFSIEPTIDFQNRLYQDLADKAMVVVLESPKYLDSKWVQFELDFMRINRIGYVALHWPNAPKSPSLDDDKRIELKDANFEGKLFEQKFLEETVLRIKEAHGESLFLMKAYLQQTLMATFPNAQLTDTGMITFEKENVMYHVWPTPRPPRVNDYHFVECRNSGNSIIVGPYFMETARRELNQWVSDKSKIKFYEEARINTILSEL